MDRNQSEILGERFRKDTEQAIDAALTRGVNPRDEYLAAVDDLMRLEPSPADVRLARNCGTSHGIDTKSDYPDSPAAFGRIGATPRIHAAATLEAPAIVACRADV